ncbi:MAG: hypothetical protein ABFC77_00050 [Thermoguttaceae bacterium]
MEIHAFGFEWEHGDAITIDDFGRYIVSCLGTTIVFQGQERLVYLKDTDGYYLGLLITSRDHKTTCELVRQHGKNYTVKIRRTTGNVHPMDFNFFIVHKQTWRGLYLHYRGSCGLSTFGGFARKMYNDCLRERCDMELNELAEQGDPNRARGKEREIKQKYKQGQFTSQPLLREEAVERLIKDLRRINKFEWTYAMPHVEQRWFSSVKNYVSTERGSFSFSSSHHHRADIKDAIIGFINAHIPRRGVIHGTTTQGEEKAVTIEVKPDVFQEWDYDAMITDDALNLSAIDKSPIFEELLSVARRNNRIIQG